MPLFILLSFNTQTMYIKSFLYTTALLCFPKNLIPGGIRTRVFSFLRRVQCPLRHAARAKDSNVHWAVDWMYHEEETIGTTICTTYETLFCLTGWKQTFWKLRPLEKKLFKLNQVFWMIKWKELIVMPPGWAHGSKRQKTEGHSNSSNANSSNANSLNAT
jgi:hypothetical protein